MDKKKNMKMNKFMLIFFLALLFLLIYTIPTYLEKENISISSLTKSSSVKILATDESEAMCKLLKQKGYDIDVTYAGALEIVDILNDNASNYDAVFLSNSIWTAMFDTSVVNMSDYETISINPIVFGVKKKKAQELGLIKDDLKLDDILQVIASGDLKFTMPSGTQTNTGASSLLGFVSTLCGNPEVLTQEHIQDELLAEKLKKLFAGVNKSSGSESFVEQLYLTGKYDAAILYETSIININRQIKNEDDIIYALYPVDGVSISDLLFGYVGTNENKKEIFDEMKKYLLSTDVQNKLEKEGYRVWYGGIKENIDKTVFNPDWGIDTTKYITPIKYPSLNVIKEIFSLYQSELRKPTHTIFVLDYSGSMYGEGCSELLSAMEYILDTEKASRRLCTIF